MDIDWVIIVSLGLFIWLLWIWFVYWLFILDNWLDCVYDWC
jgi:hypothetical protein